MRDTEELINDIRVQFSNQIKTLKESHNRSDVHLQVQLNNLQIKQVNESLQKRNGQLEKKNKALSSSLQKCKKCKLAKHFTRKSDRNWKSANGD